MASPRAIRRSVGRAYRTVRSAAGGSALVLTYHRVIELENDPESLAISPAHFEQQIRTLTAGFNVMHATELCALLARGRRIPRRTVVVTFDDGYFDLLAEAKPVLERHGVPAAAFISTAEIGTLRERWWDELAHLCLSGHTLSHRIAFTAAGRTFEHETRPEDADFRALYNSLLDHVWPLDAAGREETLEALFVAAGHTRPQRPEYRSLDADEVRELARGGLVEIGAHTVSHQMLSTVDVEMQAAEIQGGRSALEAILDCPVTLFSYPFGGREDIGPAARGLVVDAGFRCAFANWFGLTFPWTDRFAIPRCPTSDIPGAEFAHRLEQWFSIGA